MPEGIERYGITYGLDDTTKTHIQTGFDEIRAIQGWENFRIPAYVWEYVDQHDRDKNIAFLESVLYGSGISDPLEPTCPALTADLQFAFVYTLFLYLEWWRDTPDKPGEYYLLQMYSDDIGIPRSAIHVYSMRTDVLGVTVDHPLLSQLPDNKWGVDDWWITNDPSDQWGYIWAGNEDAGGFTEKDVDTDDGPYNGFCGEDWIDEGEGWDDYGEIAVWPDEAFLFPAGINVNSAYEIISGSAQFRDFGLMEGSVRLATALDVGDTVTVSDGIITYFTGIVTEVRQNLAEGTYDHRIADPVTAGGGTVEYTSGNAIAALQEAIENHGGTFSTSMTTTETVVYPNDPQDAYQFFRAVSYAVGGVLQYGRDGVYRLVATPAAHGLNDSLVIADDNPTIEERTADYANYVTASIDERWRTEATTTTTESYSVGGNSMSIERLGEQIQSVTVSYDGGAGKSISYTYDANGYLTHIDETHQTGSSTGDEKYERSVSFTNISDEGNQYNVGIVEKTYQYNQYYSASTGTYSSGWVQQTENTKDWNVDLTSLSKVEEVQKGLDLIAKAMWTTDVMYYDDDNPDGVKRESTVSIPISPSDYSGWPQLVNQHKWIASVISAPDADVLEGHCESEQYNYVVTRIEADSYGLPVARLGWARINPARAEEKTYSPPTLEMYAAEDEHEVHIIAKAKDPGSVTALGEHKYETQAVALNTSTGMSAFALEVLREKSRIRRANISIEMGTALPLDTVIWRGLEWTLKGVTVNLDGANDDLEIVTQSTTNRLSGALSKEPVTWTEDVRNAINKRVGQFDNIARGKVTGRAGYRRYTVQVEGKTDTVEAKALDSNIVAVGSSVLVIRPTGKHQQWTLLSPSKEDEIVIPTTAEENITPSADPAPPAITSFTADQYTTTPCDLRTLSWTFDSEAYSLGVDIDLNDGSDVFEVEDYGDPQTTTARFLTIGTLTPTITPWVRNIYGEKTYGDPVNLASDMVVGEPEMTVFTVESPVDLGTPSEVTIQLPYLPGLEIIVVNEATTYLGQPLTYVYKSDGGYKATVSVEGDINIIDENNPDVPGYTIFGDPSEATLHIEVWTYKVGTSTVSAKLRFIQANGEEWEGEYINKTITTQMGSTSGTLWIDDTRYVFLPSKGDYELVVANPPSMNSLSAATLNNFDDYPGYPDYHEGFAHNNADWEVEFTLTMPVIENGKFVKLWMRTPRYYWPSKDCAGGITEYYGGHWAVKEYIVALYEDNLVFGSYFFYQHLDGYKSGYTGGDTIIYEGLPASMENIKVSLQHPGGKYVGYMPESHKEFSFDGDTILVKSLITGHGWRSYIAGVGSYIPTIPGGLFKSYTLSYSPGVSVSNLTFRMPYQLVAGGYLPESYTSGCFPVTSTEGLPDYE